MATTRPTLGDAQCCGYETDKDEVCGETEVERVTGVVQVRKPLSDVTREVTIAEFLCAQHIRNWNLPRG